MPSHVVGHVQKFCPVPHGMTLAVGTTATVGSNRLLLNGNGSAQAGVRQQVTTLTPNTLHALDIYIHHGPVTFKCGSSAGLDDYLEEREGQLSAFEFKWQLKPARMPTAFAKAYPGSNFSLVSRDNFEDFIGG